MNRLPLLFAAALACVSQAWGYDTTGAARLADFYRPFSGPACARSLQNLMPEAFVRALGAGEPMLVIDVRTPGETVVYGPRGPQTLTAPLDVLFTPAILDRLPTDRKLVLLCKSGHRATAAAMGLRQIGFTNVYVLKGGLTALAGYLSPKTAY
jgi:rhodanese-related sulfurtransferase